MSVKDPNYVDYYASLNLKEAQRLIDNNQADLVPEKVKTVLRER